MNDDVRQLVAEFGLVDDPSVVRLRLASSAWCGAVNAAVEHQGAYVHGRLSLARRCCARISCGR